jgi:hypothetical protein
MGWVSCIERIALPGRSGGGASSTSLAVATNLFQRSRGQSGRWEMILHHASLIPLVVAEPMGTPEVVH